MYRKWNHRNEVAGVSGPQKHFTLKRHWQYIVNCHIFYFVSFCVCLFVHNFFVTDIKGWRTVIKFGTVHDRTAGGQACTAKANDISSPPVSSAQSFNTDRSRDSKPGRQFLNPGFGFGRRQTWVSGSRFAMCSVEDQRTTYWPCTSERTLWKCIH